MAHGCAVPRASEEFEKVRLAFVERPVRPTFSELAKEFDVPLSTVSNWSAQNGWISQRAECLEKKLSQGDVAGIILEAAGRVNRPVIAAITNAILLIVQEVTACVHSLDPLVQKSPATRAQVLNTCSFAINNVANACKTVGITGFPKELKELGATREGGWSPALQQQINLTIQNAVAPTKELAAAQPVDVKSDSVPTS